MFSWGRGSGKIHHVIQQMITVFWLQRRETQASKQPPPSAQYKSDHWEGFNGIACHNDEAEKAFTEYVHDKNFSITYIVQSGFCHGKKEGISLI